MLNDTSEMAADTGGDRLCPMVQDIIPQRHQLKLPITTELPIDHPIAMFSVATEHYHSKAPPFLCYTKTKKKPAGSRLHALLATNGKLRRPAPSVDLVLREWRNKGMYWTADVNGERIILKPFRGGPGGSYNYRQWLGPLEGFNECATAYVVPNAKAVAKPRLGKEEKHAESTGDRLTHSGQRKRRASARGAESKSQRFATDEVLNSETSSLPPPPKKRVHFPGLERPARDSVTKLHVTETENLSFSENRHRITKIPSKVSGPNVAETFAAMPRLGHSNIERLEKLFRESHPNTANTLAPNMRSFSEPSKRKRPFDLSTPTQIASKRRKHAFDSENFANNSVDRQANNSAEQKIEKLAVPVIDKPSQCQFSPIATATTTISPYKQANTNLCFFLPPGDECVPLKLRSCMTMSTFFGAATEAFDLHDQTEKIRALRITFSYVSEGDQKNTWLVKQTIPDSFEIFLDVVDRLPVWGEGGTCGVRVDIIMRS